MSEIVVYREITGFPGYRVGSDGTIWSKRITGKSRRYVGWKLLKQYRRPYGARYMVIGLRAVPGGKLSMHYVHRLILEAFVGPCPAEGMTCRHFPSNDTSDNRLSNLSWGTIKENIADKKVHGTHIFGEKSPLAKMTDAQVLRVHHLYEIGQRTSEIARIIGITPQSVREILIRKKWAATTRRFEVDGLILGKKYVADKRQRCPHCHKFSSYQSCKSCG